MHLELLDHLHRRGASSAADEDAASMEPLSAEEPFSQKMLAKVYTIVPLLWRCAVSPFGFLFEHFISFVSPSVADHPRFQVSLVQLLCLVRVYLSTSNFTGRCLASHA